MNRGARCGLEIPFRYKFFGLRKAVDWTEKSVRKVIDDVKKELPIVPNLQFKQKYISTSFIKIAF